MSNGKLPHGPYPKGPLGPNPANDTAKSAGEPPNTGAPHHEAVQAVVEAGIKAGMTGAGKNNGSQ